ncbi:MAG: 50S ribosomal protein L31e [Methanosaeta sp. PtaB.Bin039]|nr:MAG: 50S ribosomal protein L31e [Methanosaeta sp. PtaB.Bin039]OPY45482.1 MAG: 50S ribosomal protein L31e [Methanosaeta sp. PtaU1.Bin028]HOT07152.1 50S ribosomal protein L31e [Methanotrichaceae archaeon]HQF16873.1 50S ribosomal protein L31e [Methanotrichaceae archaeon]HQI91439.1 50S ribosomal protein L31e [Methanotrichaceae archaeon]
MDIEHIYTVPLGGAKAVPRWRRSKRAMEELKAFLSRNMKAPVDKIKIDNGLNEVIWARSNEKPPLQVRVKAVKFEDGGVEAEFAGDR